MIVKPPKTAFIGGKEYNIRNNGNWYDIYRVICVFNDDELSDSDKWYCALRIFFPDFDSIEDMQAAMDYVKWFIDKGESTNDDVPKATTRTQQGINISFYQDMDLMVDSLNCSKDRDIRLSYMHWWTFLGDVASHMPTGLYKSVLEVRYKLENHISLDKWEKSFLSEHRNRVILRRAADKWLDEDWE